jgi:hypothetical protein
LGDATVKPSLSFDGSGVIEQNLAGYPEQPRAKVRLWYVSSSPPGHRKGLGGDVVGVGGRRGATPREAPNNVKVLAKVLVE